MMFFLRMTWFYIERSVKLLKLKSDVNVVLQSTYKDGLNIFVQLTDKNKFSHNLFPMWSVKNHHFIWICA